MYCSPIFTCPQQYFGPGLLLVPAAPQPERCSRHSGCALIVSRYLHVKFPFQSSCCHRRLKSFVLSARAAVQHSPKMAQAVQHGPKMMGQHGSKMGQQSPSWPDTHNHDPPPQQPQQQEGTTWHNQKLQPVSRQHTSSLFVSYPLLQTKTAAPMLSAAPMFSCDPPRATPQKHKRRAQPDMSETSQVQQVQLLITKRQHSPKPSTVCLTLSP